MVVLHSLISNHLAPCALTAVDTFVSQFAVHVFDNVDGGIIHDVAIDCCCHFVVDVTMFFLNLTIESQTLGKHFPCI